MTWEYMLFRDDIIVIQKCLTNFVVEVKFEKVKESYIFSQQIRSLVNIYTNYLLECADLLSTIKDADHLISIHE